MHYELHVSVCGEMCIHTVPHKRWLSLTGSSAEDDFAPSITPSDSIDRIIAAFRALRGTQTKGSSCEHPFGG